MKKLFFLTHPRPFPKGRVILFIALLPLGVIGGGCVQSGISGNEEQQPPITLPGLNPATLITTVEANKILGEESHLADSSTAVEKGASVYRCSFTANKTDSITGKTGSVYFLLEEYVVVSDAQKKYSFIKKANEDHGIIVVQGLGDEAYFHSDNENFYFIMVRKGTRVLTMKVNKITNTTSLPEFNMHARKITEAI